MKKALVLLVVLTFHVASVLAQDADPIGDAMMHAQIDAPSYKATGWGALAFGASILLSPLLGGGAVIVAAYIAEPRVELPASRLAYAQKTYQDTQQLFLYQAQYRESMAGPIKKARSGRAWLGTGIGLGVNLIIIVSVISLMSSSYY